MSASFYQAVSDTVIILAGGCVSFAVYLWLVGFLRGKK